MILRPVKPVMSNEDVRLPSFVEERIRVLVDRTKRDYNTLVREYFQIYNTEELKQYPEEMRHSLAIKILWVQSLASRKGEAYEVIPVGIQATRIAKSSSSPYSRIYALVREKRSDAKFQKAVIVCKNQYSELWRTVDLFAKYETVLYRAGDYVYTAISGTRFDNPDTSLLLRGPDVLKKILERTFVKYTFKLNDIWDVYDKMSQADELTWVGFEGVVVYYNTGKRQDGTEWGLYIASDDSVAEEEIIDTGGELPRQKPSALMIWTAPTLITYDRDSVLYFYGILRARVADDVQQPIMEAYGLLPVVPKRLGV